MTATADADYSLLIKESLNLSKNLKIVASSPERPTLRLSCIKLKSKSFSCFDWLIALLKQSVKLKVIIYCRSVNKVSAVFQYLKCQLGSFAYVNNEGRKESIVAMYHSSTGNKQKVKVLDSLTSDSGKMKVFVATSALGCGIDAKDVNYVIHFGLTYDLADYCQQIGRAGRNMSALSHAILYFYPENSLYIKDSILKYAKNSETNCLRKMLYTPFNESETEIMSYEPKHLCCSYCTPMCKCGENCKAMFEFEKSFQPQSTASSRAKVRTVSDSDRDLVKDLLEEFHSQYVGCSTVMMTPAPLVTGITPSVIDSILSQLEYIDSIDHVLRETNVFEAKVANEVVVIINEVFGECIECSSSDQINEENISVPDVVSAEDEQGYVYEFFSEDDEDFLQEIVRLDINNFS